MRRNQNNELRRGIEKAREIWMKQKCDEKELKTTRRNIVMRVNTKIVEFGRKRNKNVQMMVNRDGKMIIATGKRILGTCERTQRMNTKMLNVEHRRGDSGFPNAWKNVKNVFSEIKGSKSCFERI